MKMHVVPFGGDLKAITVPHEGVVGMHRLWPQVRDYMIYEEDGVMDNDTDGLIVSCDDSGEVMSYIFAPAPEDEDERKWSTMEWIHDWTCLKDL